MLALMEVIFWFDPGRCVGGLVTYGSDYPGSIPEHVTRGVGDKFLSFLPLWWEDKH